MTGPTDKLAELARVTKAIPSGAACTGSRREFIDVDPLEGRDLIAQFCLNGCPFIAECRAVGDDLAPHRFASVFGGRFYERDEPRDGWQVAS